MSHPLMKHQTPVKAHDKWVNNLSTMKHIAKEVDYGLLYVTSSAFEEGAPIPVKFTCDGENISPPIEIDHIPQQAVSLALIADDPDAPGKTWVHWVMWNIPVTHHLKENQAHGIQGMNDFGKNNYGGPCPPGGTHRYCFKIYALDCILFLPLTANKHDLEKAMSGHILAFGQLTGTYIRQ